MLKMSRGTDVTHMRRTYRTATKEKLPDKLTFELAKKIDLRYGENPNQPAAVYRLSGIPEFTNMRVVKSGKQGLSATNMMDVVRALNILKYFDDPSVAIMSNAVAVMKHTIPSGFSTQFNNNSLDNIYLKARDTDARSAFGSVVVLNKPLDKATAEAIMSTFVEVVAATGYEPGTMDILSKKKDIRAVSFSNIDKLPKFIGDDTGGLYDIKFLPDGQIIVQKPYLSSIKSAKDLILDPLVKFEGKDYVVERDPTPEEMKDLLIAWYMNLGVRSNGIVFVKDGTTVAVGTGEMERVGAGEQGITKAYQKALDRQRGADGAKVPWTAGGLSWSSMRNELDVNPLLGAVVSSDAFFPFRDSIDTIAEQGVTAIIQPGGSKNDYEVIQAVNENGMAMAYTLERCFGHF
jgi:phosphoribosylaminoimidazolecarboxamide formyltransferase/IMP cyclohydrolase